MTHSRDQQLPSQNSNGNTLQSFPTFKDKKNGATFTTMDYQYLNQNEHYRYLPSSKTVGHAVITKNTLGETVARQYAIPDDTSDTKVLPLQNISEITRYGMTRHIAYTHDGVPMYAKRYISGKVGKNQKEDDFNIACFSPKREEEKEPFWGSSEKEIPIFRDDLKPKQKKELQAELNEIKPSTKGGEELALDSESVHYRDSNKKRTPDQNTVMKESAKDAYEAFLITYEKELSPKMREIITKSINAPLKNMFKSQNRPEWLHAYGFSLVPVANEPQQKANLGAAPKWVNTEMMVLERIAKWFALNEPHLFVAIKPHFEMLLDTELVKHVHFEVTVKDKESWIQLLQDLNPFKQYPLYRKPSDLAQGTAIAYSMLHNVPPISEQKIQNAAFSKPASSVNALSSTSSTSSTTTTTTPSVTVTPEPKKQEPQITAPIRPILKPVQNISPTRIAADPIPNKDKHLFPTHHKNEDGIVQVFTKSHEPDYDEPWNGTHIVNSSGTGLVITNNDKKYILTNAHCVENQILIRVRIANNRKKYEAKTKCVSYQCDLALLEVTDPEFNELATPITFGDMVRLQEEVKTIGFPMGGSEISISRGIVSRIEVHSYAMSGLDMLQVQIDAAVNPGNSGGPVFSGDNVVGIAFQGINRQGLGYMIPTPVIKHFLYEAFNAKVYRGFPVLPITTQVLKNPSLRKYYDMKEDETGIRISKIDLLCDANKKLKPDDIILEIDSLKVSNDGTVDIPGIGKCIDLCHVTQMKYIGDTVNLKILRKNSETQRHERLTISVILDSIPHDTEKVSQSEHDKLPTYYIASGISFIPLSRNYIEGNGGDFEEQYVMEEGCFLADSSKKTPDEQIVVINSVLDCEETEGYGGYENMIVKEINGKTINNLHDVIDAIENHNEPLHHISTTSKRVMVIKNMSKEEHEQLLSRYHITRDRSKDLLTYHAKKPQIVQQNTTAPATLSTTISNPPSSVTSQIKAIAIDLSDKDDDNKITTDLPFAAGATLGSRRFFDAINNIEQRFKDLPDDEDEDEQDDEFTNDDAMESESLSSSDDLNDDEEMSEATDDNTAATNSKKPKTKNTSSAAQNSHRFFNKRKRSDADDDEVEEPPHKKQRRR